MATLNKFFKGILQYKSTDNFTKEPGYIYFVRNVGSDDAEVYFGTRKYGEVNASKLTELQNLISDNTQSIAAIAGKVGDWVNNTATIAQAVIEVSGATQTNAEEITKKVDTTAYTAYTAATETTISNAKNAAISASTGNTQTQIQALDSRVSGAALEERITIEVAQENGKLSQLTLTASNIAKNTDLTAHTSNTDIHVTTEDKTKWNKAKEDIDAFLAAADSGETALDTLKELQTYINSDSGVTQTMLNNIASAQRTANQAVEDAAAAQADVNNLSGTVTTHTSNTDIHVTTEDKTKWNKVDEKVDTTAYTAYTAATETTISNAKNAAISASTGNTQTQIQALDSRVSGAALEERITIEVAQENGKLSQLTLTASNIAKNTVLTAHTSNTDIHVTTEDKTKWNKVDEKVDTTVYTAYTGETKAVIDQIKEDLSAITNGAVTSVTSTGKTVTVTESEGAVNVEVNTLSVASAQANGYIALEHGTDGALYGVMYYGGDDAE